jgi:hypothetical protein
MSSTPPNASAPPPPTFSLLPAGASSATTLNPAIAIDTTAAATPTPSAPHSASSEYGPPSPSGSAEPFAPKSSLGLRDNVDVSNALFFLLCTTLCCTSQHGARCRAALSRGSRMRSEPLRVRLGGFWRYRTMQRGTGASSTVNIRRRILRNGGSCSCTAASTGRGASFESLSPSGRGE